MMGATDNNQLPKRGKRSGGCCDCSGDNGEDQDENDGGNSKRKSNGEGRCRGLMDAMVKVHPCWLMVQGWRRVPN